MKTKSPKWTIFAHSYKHCSDKEFSSLAKALAYIRKFAKNPSISVSLHSPDSDPLFDNCQCERKDSRRREKEEEQKVVESHGSILKLLIISADNIPPSVTLKTPMLIEGRFRQVGRNLLGDCPFACEIGASPAYTLSKWDEKGGMHHCFGCGIGGRFEWRCDISKIKGQPSANLH